MPPAPTPGGRLGELHDPETHLIPLILRAAGGQLDHVEVYGTDHLTKDGTAVRDYIHVNDLAQAHVLGMTKLEGNTTSFAYNLGNGKGYSVREVIETAQRVTGKEIRTVERPRRPGDPAELVGSAEKAKAELGWNPEYPDLETIIRHAWRWHQVRCGVDLCFDNRPWRCLMVASWRRWF